MISAVVSDLGGVLTTPLYDAFVAYQDHSGVPLEEFGMALGNLTLRTGANPMAELETGRLTEAEFLSRLGAQLTEQCGRAIDISDFSEVWFRHLLPNTAMLELMRSLRDRGYRMALLTNNVREWEHRWRPTMPIDEIFSQVIDSGFVGMRKPDPEIYALTVERLGVQPDEILFVNDMEENCRAARAAGWTAIQFVSNDQAIPEIEAALGAEERPAA